MQVTIPQLTIGLLKCNPGKPLYFERWSNGSFMIGLWRAIIFVTVWPNWPNSLNDPGDDDV